VYQTYRIYLGNWWVARGMDVLHNPHSSYFPRNDILNSVKTTEQLLWFPMQARFFFGSYWKGSEWRPKQKLQTNRWDSDKITNLRILMHKAREHQQPLYTCFVNFKKAFDSISHDKLWVSMTDMGYPLHLIDLLDKLYRKQLAKVKIAGTLSEWFPVKKGVRQGCNGFYFTGTDEFLLPSTGKVYIYRNARCVCHRRNSNEKSEISNQISLWSYIKHAQDSQIQ